MRIARTRQLRATAVRWLDESTAGGGGVLLLFHGIDLDHIEGGTCQCHRTSNGDQSATRGVHRIGEIFTDNTVGRTKPKGRVNVPSFLIQDVVVVAKLGQGGVFAV